MPEEQIKEPEVKETVTGKVTDAQLDSASELFTDEKVEPKIEVKPEVKEEPIEVVKTKEQLDEEEEHRERSRLGRRLKSMEDKQAERERLEEERWARIEAKLTQPIVSHEIPIEDGLPEIISTPEDVRKVNEYDRQKKIELEEIQKKMENPQYAKEIEKLKEIQKQFYEQLKKMPNIEGKNTFENYLPLMHPKMESDKEIEKPIDSSRDQLKRPLP